MNILKYRDAIVDVFTLEYFIESLLGAEGFNPKTPVSHRINELPVVEYQQGDNFIDNFDPNGLIVLDLGNDTFIPTTTSAWRIEQYRYLDGTPYLGLKMPVDAVACRIIPQKEEPIKEKVDADTHRTTDWGTWSAKTFDKLTNDMSTSSYNGLIYQDND